MESSRSESGEKLFSREYPRADNNIFYAGFSILM